MTNISEKLCEVNYSRYIVNCFKTLSVDHIYNEISEFQGSTSNNYYLLQNGRKLSNSEFVVGQVQFVPRLVGGKGGFASMLKAIGAQIEKTTNSEACRDLSGRRIRDINEEQRLKNYIAQREDREREAVERKRKKLERLCQEPNHDFRDETYEKLRSELSERVSNSVEEGFKKAGTSGNPLKRHISNCDQGKKKKEKLWIDAGDDISSSGSELEESETVSTLMNKCYGKQTVAYEQSSLC